MVKSKKTFKKREEIGGIAFVGFLFIGMALGAVFGRWDVGVFLGLGMGFVAMATLMIKGIK